MTHQYDSSRIESDLHSLQQGTSEDGMGWDGMGWDGMGWWDACVKYASAEAILCNAS